MELTQPSATQSGHVHSFIEQLSLGTHNVPSLELGFGETMLHGTSSSTEPWAHQKSTQWVLSLHGEQKQACA